jgi:GPH family glycoside/pentoside/hexuronide:cation symporter
MQYVTSTLGTYMYADVLGNVSLMSLTSVISMPFMIAILVFAPMLAKKFGLVPTIRASLLIGSVLYISLFALHMVMDVPAMVHMLWSASASGVGMMSIQMQWGMVGEAIDYNEYLTGKRTEGSIYGTFNLTRRIGQTIGNSAAVLALGWIGYDATIAAAGGVQAASVLTGIKALCVLVPGIFVLGSWAAFKYVWNITPEIKAEMAAAKAAKKAAQE